MQHIDNLKEILAQTLNLTTIVEPTKVLGPREIRIAAKKITLTPTEGIRQGGCTMGQTYRVDVALAICLRILGGNDSGRYTRDCTLQAIKLAEFWQWNPLIKLAHVEEDLGDGVALAGEAVVHDPKKTGGEFYRMGEDDHASGKLFLYREDWDATLTTRAVRTFDVPMLTRVTFTTPDGSSFEVTS
jgi:hypothetical protein